MMGRGRAGAVALIGVLALVVGAGGCRAGRHSAGGPGAPAAGLMGAHPLPVWARTLERTCVVPPISGAPLRVAARALRATGCHLVAVGHRYSRRLAPGRVLSQRPGQETALPRRGRVDVVVSRGPRPPDIARCRVRARHYRTLPSFGHIVFCVAPGPQAERTHEEKILVTPRREAPWSRNDNAAMIVSSTGRLLWYRPSLESVHDLKTVRYHGRTLLALYHRRRHHGSFYELRDHRYRVVRRIRMGGHVGTDMHDLQITPSGTAYLSGYRPVWRRGIRVTDYVLRELDLRSGRVLFEWHSLRHVPVSASYLPLPPAGHSWDYFHGNSIQPPVAGDRTIIVSSRNTSAVYGIDRATGRIRWTLGGKRNQFRIVGGRPPHRFCTQHDVRRLPNGDLSMFDNGGNGRTAGTGCPIHRARVLEFRLHPASRTARVVRTIPSHAGGGTGRPLFPIALGSDRREPDGTMLIDWGTMGRITEVTPAGRVRFALRLPGASYRAVTARWVGRPAGRPIIAAERRPGGTVDVWASWNGATEIERWQLLAGQAPERLHAVGRPVAFADLETLLHAHTAARLVAVRALDARGRALGRSKAVRLR